MMNKGKTYASIFPSFVKYVFPSIFGMLAVSLNTVVDALICGNGIGGGGISGVNIGTPIISLCFASGMLFGSGGGTLFSVSLGKKRSNDETEDTSARIFTESTCYVILLGLIAAIIIFFLRASLPYILGATAETYNYAFDYEMGVLPFIPVFMIDVYLNIYSRNDNAPNASMIATFISVGFGRIWGNC